MAAHRIELCLFSQKDSRISNQAHADIMAWQRKYPHIRHRLSHDKREVTFDDTKYFNMFKETYKHWFRQIY